jgi:hypothetical protein
MTEGELPVDEASAVVIAAAECATRGHDWIEPIQVDDEDRDFVIRTNAETLGGNCLIRVEKASGQVSEFHFYAR